MGGSHSSAGSTHIYQEIGESQAVQPRFDRRESTATLDIRVEDWADLGRRRMEQAGEEHWDNEDGGDGGGWCQDMGWGEEDVRTTRTRKRGAISNVTFYENIDKQNIDNNNVAEANVKDVYFDKTEKMKPVKYKRCKSIDIKVLDVKDGESIEF
eukprot:GFUD01016855.1.p1 GENE.GFUD01016855.1~~GFUD01016855.1.p1  ORF type:complete len:154 (-),score=43.93 GFUD01016855.1:90-551(-)